jgi:hypothetical protein
MSIVIYGTRTPYEVPQEFVLERIEALTTALGGTAIAADNSMMGRETSDDRRTERSELH